MSDLKFPAVNRARGLANDVTATFSAALVEEKLPRLRSLHGNVSQPDLERTVSVLRSMYYEARGSWLELSRSYTEGNTALRDRATAAEDRMLKLNNLYINAEYLLDADLILDKAEAQRNEHILFNVNGNTYNVETGADTANSLLNIIDGNLK